MSDEAIENYIKVADKERRTIFHRHYYRIKRFLLKDPLEEPPGCLMYVLSKTLREHAPRLAANVAKNNHLLERLRKK